MTAPAWDDRLELVRRKSDGEQIGILRPFDGGLCEPLSLLGIAPGTPLAREDALRPLNEQGLESLSRRWRVRAPVPLAEKEPDARSVDESVGWRTMVVAELTPQRALLRSSYPSPEEGGRYVSVTLPAGDVL